MVALRIADSGSGLSDAVFGRLFEPFQTTKPTGTGLGLALSRSIVEAHGGQLWAERPASGGAVFGLTLPVAAGA
jgi:two-component system sensor kinase FixL